jgi:hypothetical protein
VTFVTRNSSYPRAPAKFSSQDAGRFSLSLSVEGGGVGRRITPLGRVMGLAPSEHPCEMRVSIIPVPKLLLFVTQAANGESSKLYVRDSRAPATIYMRFLQIYPAAQPGLSFSTSSQESERPTCAFAKFHIVIVTGVGG